MKTLLASALLATATLQSATADLFPSFQAGRNRVNFISQGERLVGTLFLPSNYTPGQQYPALIVEGPWTQVKEQVGYRYAQELVESGYAVLAFDPRFFGESAGTPRQWESTTEKVKDIRNAVSFLQTLPVVQPDHIGLLGVCAGAGIAARVVAEDKRIQSFATVAAWLQHPSTTPLFYEGKAGVERRIQLSEAAQKKYEQIGKVDYVAAYDTTQNAGAAMFFPIDYYGNAKRGAIPQWKNQFAVLGWKEWLSLNAIDGIAERITVPTLMVHSDSSALPQNVRAFYEKLSSPKRLAWTEGEHTAFYDQEKQVRFAVNAVRKHFDQTLKPSLAMQTNSVIDAVNGVFINSDERRWDRVKASFADQVMLDYTSMAGGQPATLTPQQIVDAWTALLPGFQYTHHQIGNYVVEENGNTASVFCYGTATHYLPNDSRHNLWTVVGTYDFHLTKQDATWKVDAMTFHLKYQDGNLDLPDLARKKRSVINSR